MTYELHPLCTLFPRMSGSEFDALANDIKANGLRQPIVLFDGMVLDGGNRYRACLNAGIEPTFIDFHGENIVSFVLSANFHRRHLTVGQQAAIVASAQDWAKAQPGHRPNKEKGCNVAPLSTVDDRIAQSGASRRTQKMADKVAKAAPDLAKRVAHGEVSLPAAIKQLEPTKAVSKRAPPAPAESEGAALDDPDLVSELEHAHKTIEQMTAELRVAEADDLKAEALKWKRMHQVAERRQSELMDAAASADKHMRFLKRQLDRCGKVVGESDPDKIAPAVEAFVRRHAKEAA